MLGIMEIPANQTCTSVPQQWHKPRGATIEPELVMKCVFLEASTDTGSKRKLPPVTCKPYDARSKNLKLSGWKQHDIMEMCNNLSKEEKKPFSLTCLVIKNNPWLYILFFGECPSWFNFSLSTE